MTILAEDQPHKCIYKVQNGQITTVCDRQCNYCRNNQNEQE